MFWKEIKNGIKEAHGMKARVFSISVEAKTPEDVNGDGANSQLAPWSKLGANAPTWERLPWDANDADARFCWFPVLVRSRSFPFVLLGENTPRVEGRLREGIK